MRAVVIALIGARTQRRGRTDRSVQRQFSILFKAPIQAVHKALPDLSLDDAGVFMTFFYVFVAGIWPVSDPPLAVAEMLARPEFSDMSVDFEGVARTHAHTVLRGLCRSD
ncbi:MAG: hypothetical protein O6834_01715 [Actinobacteria bacterium]|nr:hypothetical protein [Actinomycetota bacterium]MCZ6738507.1 hypothetical protein [Actinomycetota bacterium]